MVSESAIHKIRLIPEGPYLRVELDGVDISDYVQRIELVSDATDPAFPLPQVRLTLVAQLEIPEALRAIVEATISKDVLTDG